MTHPIVITNHVLDEVFVERERQTAKWGEQNLPDLTPRGAKWGSAMHARELGILESDAAKLRCEGVKNEGKQNWGAILVEELAEAVEQAALKNQEKLRKELIQVCAVACAWVEAIDRRPKPKKRVR